MGAIPRPEVRLRFLSTIWPADFQTLRADVEIPFGSHKQFGKDAILLEPNELVALKSPRSGGDFSELPLIEAVGTSGGWKAWAGTNVNARRPQFLVDTFGAALNLAVHGAGVALASDVLGRHASETGQHPRPNGGFIQGLAVGAYWQPKRHSCV
uniref:hypothetical protein n=1 Tax=Yoonia sp. TaxID=2212373 RepID=UPI004047DE27